jgi:hypothetical protein
LTPLKPRERPSRYKIEKYKTTKFFAVMAADELIVVCAYRKGARALLPILDELDDFKRRFQGLKLLGDLVEVRHGTP